MLRMVLVGLLIPLGIGVLSAMELRTPPRSAVAIVQPLAEPMADDSDSHEALAKGDRLDVAAASRGTPEQDTVRSATPEVAVVRSVAPEQSSVRSETSEPAVAINESNALPENNSIGSSVPPRPTARHNSRSKEVRTTVRPRSEPKATMNKRRVISQGPKAASNTEPCRLEAFGGLRKALNTADCEI
jgi:hypothetical protein